MAVDGVSEAAWTRADAETAAGDIDDPSRTPVHVADAKPPPAPAPDGETSPHATPRPVATASRADPTPTRRTT